MRTPNTNVPNRPGLYAIGHIKTLGYGLEVKRVYAYIGESRNLHKRLEQHRTQEEKNPELRKYLLKSGKEAKCWFATVDGIMNEKERKKCEEELIGNINPRCNRKGKTDNKEVAEK